jgi:hypothetical protein
VGEVSLGFGEELSLSIYPHTDFDYPDALCRASQKERRTEYLGIGMRRLNLYRGAIRRVISQKIKTVLGATPRFSFRIRSEVTFDILGGSHAALRTMCICETPLGRFINLTTGV